MNQKNITETENTPHGTSQQSLCKCDLSVVRPPPVCWSLASLVSDRVLIVQCGPCRLVVTSQGQCQVSHYDLSQMSPEQP